MCGLEVVEGQLAVLDSEVVQWENTTEIRAADPVSALDETPGQPVCRRWIAVLAGADDRANVLVGERHHQLRRPKGVVRQTIDERRDPVIRRPALRIERLVVDVADTAQLPVPGAHPRRRVDAETQHVGCDRLDAGVQTLAALPRALGPVQRAAAERGREVEEVVANGWRTALVDEEVGAVDRPHVAVVEPRTEYEQAPQVAPMLVRHHVVGIVAADAEYLVRPEHPRLSPRETCGDGPIRGPGPRRHGPEKPVDVELGQGTRASGIGHGLPGLRRDELAPIEANDIVLADVIAERVEET